MKPVLFTSQVPWNPERIRALCIYCSDGRWGAAFDEFCHDGLQIPRYDRFAVPGGPVWLTPRHISLLTPYTAARDQLQFLVQAHELERIVLVGHYGCAYYAEITGRDAEANLALQEEDLRAAEANLAPQEEDLRAAAVTLRGWFDGIHVEAYMATRPEGRLSFHPVDC